MMASFLRLLKVLVPRSLRNWLRSPARSALWIWDELRHILGMNPTVTILANWSLKCHPRAARWFQEHVMNDPEQCCELQNFIALVRTDMVLFDVGAHFGLFTLAALHFGGAGARAVAVDPSPSAVRLVRRQMAINGYGQDRCRAVQAAVGSIIGRMQLVAVGPLAGGYYVSPSPGHSEADLSSVATTTVDRLSEEFGWMPTHLKVDVEGAEAAVLRGAERTLRHHPAPVLCLELHNEMIRSQGDDPTTAPALLESIGYNFSDLHGNPLSPGGLIAPDLIRVTASKPS